MSLLEHEPLTFATGEAEALFEEARSRTRRRRRRGALAALLIAAAAVVSYLASSSGGSGVIAQTASTPFVNVRGFAHDGELAFISRGALWVLDGPAGAVRELRTPRGFTPASPSFSHDGRWLAYLATPAAYSDLEASQLWLARADGSHAHRVGRLDIDQLVGWNPKSDLLAAITDTHVRFLFGGRGLQPSALSLVIPGARVRQLVALTRSQARSRSIWAAAWSPHGNAVAVSTYDVVRRGGTAVLAYPVNGGPPTTWFSIAGSQGLPNLCSHCGGKEVIAGLAGWWQGWGIAFWAFCCGMVHNNDGSQLELLHSPRATPHVIANTLSDGITNALASGPGGALALVSNRGDREIGSGKQVEVCAAGALRCHPLPRASVWSAADPQTHCPAACRPFPHAPPGKAGSGVSLDPSWSPDGRLLAYVKAPVALTGGWPTPAWYGAHELFVWDPQTNSTRRLGAINGAAVPAWSKDGQDLLYVSGDGLWLAPLKTARAVEIEHPLFKGTQWFGSDAYYGQIPWSAQFAWWSP